MMAKLRKGSNFRGCVNYVTRAKKDNPDGSPCDEWRLIDAEGVATYGGREEIIASFEDNQALNPKLKNVVGHFSLNFHANDKDKITALSFKISSHSRQMCYFIARAVRAERL